MTFHYSAGTLNVWQAEASERSDDQFIVDSETFDSQHIPIGQCIGCFWPKRKKKKRWLQSLFQAMAALTSS